MHMSSLSKLVAILFTDDFFCWPVEIALSWSPPCRVLFCPDRPVPCFRRPAGPLLPSTSGSGKVIADTR
jgi:hypothetical protein